MKKNRKLWALLSIFLMAALVLGACGTQTEEPTEEEPFKAGMVTDVGGVDDKSFNAASWEGLQRAEENLEDFESQVLESQQQTDYATNIQQLLDQDTNLIVTVGFLLGEDTQTFAADNPESLFAIVDFAYEDPPDNLKGITFSTDEAAFLAGYVAAGMTETGKVGMFGGLEIPTVTIFMDGFAAGVEYYNAQKGTDVEALGRNLFVGNFESTEDGRNTGQTLIDEGADIIMPVAGPVGLGTAAVAQENEGVKVIWVDTDGCVSAPEYCDVFLTSVMKNMSNAVLDVSEKAYNGETEDWSVPYDGTLDNGGVGIAPFNEFEDAVPDELKNEVEDIKQMIIDGELTTTGEAVAPEPEEEEEAEEITLRVFAGNVGKELELTKAAAERYMEQNPNITVEVVDTPDFVEDRLGVYLQLFEAQSPEGDVFQIDVIWPGDLAEHFVDLYDYGAGDVVDNHFDAIIQNNTVDGKLVGIPWFTDAGLLYYRTDLLDKYGYDSPPETWAELEDMAQTIQEGEREDGNQDFWGFVWQGNAYEGLTCDALEWVYSNGGGTIVSADKVMTVNNEKAIDAVELAAGWVGTISPPGVTGFGEEDARGVWQAGNAAFMRNWPYAYSLGQSDDSVIKDKFDVSPLPEGDSGHSAATLGGWQLAVSKYSEHPEEAAKLAMYMGSESEQKVRAIEGSFNPTIKSLYEDEDVLEAAPFFGSLFDVFTQAVARPSTATAPNYAETSRIFFNGVHDVLTGQKDALTAFEEMELDMQDLLEFEIGEPVK